MIHEKVRESGNKYNSKHIMHIPPLKSPTCKFEFFFKTRKNPEKPGHFGFRVAGIFSGCIPNNRNADLCMERLGGRGRQNPE